MLLFFNNNIFSSQFFILGILIFVFIAGKRKYFLDLLMDSKFLRLNCFFKSINVDNILRFFKESEHPIISIKEDSKED